MKRLLVLIAFLFVTGIGYCVTQYNAVGNIQASTSTFVGGLGLWNQTKAQIAALTATTTGQQLFCTDCAANGNAGTVCTSTGSVNIGSFTLSTGTVCK